jgi:DhnA family fructose-bisphosphate aldolase class Ia
MNTGKQLRLRRIWKHRRAVIIPFDHGQYGGVPKGLEDPRRLTERIASTAADAILVTPGVLQSVAGSVGSLGVVLRLDGGFTKYTPVAGDYESVVTTAHAVSLGVDAGIVFTFVGTTFDARSLARLGQTAEEANRQGLPLISEVLPPSLLNDHFEREIVDASLVRRDAADETLHSARIAAEHGADIIKTRYSGDTKSFRAVVRSCGVKVIVAGGPKTAKGDEALLQFARECVDAGAAGIVFGRSVWHHPRVEKLIAALCAIVHADEPVRTAAKLLR